MPKQLIKILNEHKIRQQQLGYFAEQNKILGDGRSLRDSTLQKKGEKYAKIAGVKYISPHDFRHTHTSLLVNKGVNIQVVAQRLGHSDIAMTWNTYSHLYPKSDECVMKILNNL